MSSISYHLNNFPVLNQNHEDLGQLYPNVNGDMDCVPTSIAAALTYFTGQQYYGDEIIDAVYGSGYTGGTAAVQYISYCAARGVHLYPVNGTPDELVSAIHVYIQEGHPVLVTVPGQWNNPATSGTNPGAVTHVMVVCGDGPGLIQVMNPWTGAFEVYSDAWFHVKLCYGQIWPMEKISMIPQGWTDDGQTITAPNGVKFGSGFAALFRAQPFWYAENVPLSPGEYDVTPVSIAQPEIGGGTRLDFHYGESFIWSRTEQKEKFAPVHDEMVLLQQSQAKAQSDLMAEQTDVVNLKMQANADQALIGQLKAQVQALMSQPVSGNAADTAAMDELAKALPMLAKALSSRAPGLVQVGAQTKPLPAVQ